MEAGDISGHELDAVFVEAPWREIMEGSVEAAQTLHEALFPRWSWSITSAGDGGFEVSLWNTAKPLLTRQGRGKNPGLAWMVALCRIREIACSARQMESDKGRERTLP